VIRFALAALAATSLSCKFQLTPETLAKTYKSWRSAREDLTPDNEYYVGRSVATNLLSKASYQYADADRIREGQLGDLSSYVGAVGSVLAAHALESPRKDDRPAPIAGWHFVVVEDDTINAFAAPGGYILINKGLVKAARNEDELAAVIAHEIAHVVRGHALGSIKESRMSNVGKEFLDSTVTLDQQALGNLTQAFEGAMDDMIDSLTVKGYSRDTEFEADRIGLQIMVKAGYDPKAFIRLLETLDARHEVGGGGFSATHPKPSDRIAKLKAEVGKHKAVKVPKVRVERFQSAIAALTTE
jgi:predicted Zn-dependent protease